MTGTAASRGHNLFLALQPDAPLRAAIVALCAGLRETRAPGGRWLDPAHLHLTLHFLGHQRAPDAALLARVVAAAAGVEGAPFDLQLDRVDSFGGHARVLWLGPSQPAVALGQLHATLGHALREAGVALPAGPPWSPHVTLLRGLRTAWTGTRVPPLRWPVREFVLVDSCVQDPPVQRVLARWPLAAGR